MRLTSRICELKDEGMILNQNLYQVETDLMQKFHSLNTLNEGELE